MSTLAQLRWLRSTEDFQHRRAACTTARCACALVPVRWTGRPEHPPKTNSSPFAGETSLLPTRAPRSRYGEGKRRRRSTACPQHHPGMYPICPKRLPRPSPPYPPISTLLCMLICLRTLVPNEKAPSSAPQRDFFRQSLGHGTSKASAHLQPQRGAGACLTAANSGMLSSPASDTRRAR